MKPPACPVEEDVRRWVEARMRWLADAFGEDRLRTAVVVTPTTEFFPDRWDATEADAEALAERVAGYMGLDFGEIEVYPYDVPPRALPEMNTPHAAGLYEEEDGRYYVGYDAAGLDDPLQLAATFAHEFAHIHLLGHRRIRGDEPDHELLTDLCCVFLGLGVLVANAGVHEKTIRDGHFVGWQLARQGYLDLRTFGYAFAAFAHLRREENPDWARHLRPDVRSTMAKGMKRLAIVGMEPTVDRSAFVVPASLRSQLELAGSPVNDEESPDSDDDEMDDAPACDYCGAAVKEGDPEAEELLCDGCRRSIEENDAAPPVNAAAEQAAAAWDGFVLAAFSTAVLFGVAAILYSLF
jgi:hypothetical protein